MKTVQNKCIAQKWNDKDEKSSESLQHRHSEFHTKRGRVDDFECSIFLIKGILQKFTNFTRKVLFTQILFTE